MAKKMYKCDRICLLIFLNDSDHWHNKRQGATSKRENVRKWYKRASEAFW